MSTETKIEWCDSTFNPWIGCTKISPACDHCYAEADMDKRRHRVKWGAGNPRSRTSVANWKLPVRWNAQPFAQCNACGWRGVPEHGGDPFIYGSQLFHKCGACGKDADLKPARRRVFCASLADVFDNEVDPTWRANLFALIESTSNLDWLLLTKRIGNVAKMAPAPWIGGPVQHGPDPTNIHGGWPANVWLGATICNQAEAERDIPKLLSTPAAVRFLSMEPLLGSVDLASYLAANDLHEIVGGPRIDWVIVGGESGAGARPMHPDWARSLRDQCAAAGVPFLFKQWGNWANLCASGLDVNDCYDTSARGGWIELDGTCSIGETATPQRIEAAHVFNLPKQAAGRMLDGVQHDGFPDVRHA